MSNVTVIKDKYENIQEVSAKKIKLTANNLDNLYKEEVVKDYTEDDKKDLKIKEEVKFEKKEEVTDKKDENVPSYLSIPDKEEYTFDKDALKEKIAGNYGNSISSTKKEEKKINPVPEHKITEAEFEKLLNADVVIMKDQKDKFKEVFVEKQTRLNQAKLDQAKYADSFQTTSNEEQVAKADVELKKKRTSQMKDPSHFTYLEIGKNEDRRIVDAVRAADEALKNLYNVNQIVAKELEAQIEQYEKDKKDINRASEKVRAEIHKAAEDLNKFMEEKAPILKDINSIDAKYKDAEAESEKAIKDEYEALTKERSSLMVEEPQVEEIKQAEIVPEIKEEVSSPALDNFKKVTAVHGMDDSLMGINDLYNDMQAKQNIGEGRVL